jgi:aminomethyltransferase
MRPTPLSPAYRGRPLGAVDLLGWAYPSAFSRPAEEHRTVRSAAGLFDFSFMAHVVVGGPGALASIQRLVTNDVSRLLPGRGLYSPILNERGTLVDDCTVIRRRPDEYLISAGLEETAGWLLAAHAPPSVALEDCSAALSVIAVQGPASPRVLEEAGCRGARALGYFGASEVTLGGTACLLARIGYTGELGYELFVPAEAGPEAWGLIEVAGRGLGLLPCGALALDSLRIEAGYLMTRVDFDASVTPIEAGLGPFVKADKGEFVGREALALAPVRQRLRGLRGTGPDVPARGALVLDGRGRRVGRVTSASPSPTLGGAVAFAYLAEPPPDGPLAVEGVPGGMALAERPFYDPGRRRVRADPRRA